MRDKIAGILRQRHLVSPELDDALEFIAYAEEHVTDTMGNTPTLTLDLILRWSHQQRLLYLAESFLKSGKVLPLGALARSLLLHRPACIVFDEHQ